MRSLFLADRQPPQAKPRGFEYGHAAIKEFVGHPSRLTSSNAT